MIPQFDDNGYLPPGIHPATLDEIEARFGSESEIRRAEMQSLRWLVDLLLRAGAKRLIVNGSFVTDVYEPNDVDCAVLIEAGFPFDEEAEAEIVDGLPFIQVSMLEQERFDTLVNRYYASDRVFVPKGMIEVKL